MLFESTKCSVCFSNWPYRKIYQLWSVLSPGITLVTFKITLWTYFKKKRTINTLKHYWNNVWWAQSTFRLICSQAKSLAHLHWNNIVTFSLFIVSNKCTSWNLIVYMLWLFTQAAYHKTVVIECKLIHIKWLFLLSFEQKCEFSATIFSIWSDFVFVFPIAFFPSSTNQIRE